MIVNSTELQNNFGKYLFLAAQADITVTRNGIPIAKLSGLNKADTARERTEAYSAPGSVTFEEFREMTRSSEERYELIDGEVYLLTAPQIAHQYSVTEILAQFYPWCKERKCMVFTAPNNITLVRRPGNINVVQPDLMVICDLEESLSEDGYYKGVPALIVEIISESTRSKDLVKKLDLYMGCGVQEYWVVNPLNREVTVYLFRDHEIGDSKTYRQEEIALSGIFPGLAIAVNNLFL
jgi:Uma2 family endonuclease